MFGLQKIPKLLCGGAGLLLLHSGGFADDYADLLFLQTAVSTYASDPGTTHNKVSVIWPTLSPNLTKLLLDAHRITAGSTPFESMYARDLRIIKQNFATPLFYQTVEHLVNSLPTTHLHRAAVLMQPATSLSLAQGLEEIQKAFNYFIPEPGTARVDHLCADSFLSFYSSLQSTCLNLTPVKFKQAYYTLFFNDFDTVAKWLQAYLSSNPDAVLDKSTQAMNTATTDKERSDALLLALDPAHPLLFEDFTLSQAEANAAFFTLFSELSATGSTQVVDRIILILGPLAGSDPETFVRDTVLHNIYDGVSYPDVGTYVSVVNEALLSIFPNPEVE